MKTSKKTILFIILFSAILFFIPSFCNAESKTANNDETLRNAITQGEEDVEITLEDDIELDSPIEFTNKTVTINGEGHTISTTKKLADESWPRVGNATLLTAGTEEAKLILNNVKLANAPKYGAQAYNGGTLILNGVTISGCGYGAVITNAGIVEVEDLTLGKNGENENVGIEIAKSSSLGEGKEPKLIMNGTLNSDQTKNVVYLAVNDSLTTFDIENSDTTTDKIFVNGNTVVVTDAENNIKFVSNENFKEGLKFDGDPFVPNITLTIRVMYKTVEKQIMQNSVVSMDELNSLINLEELGYGNYTLDGFYLDPDFTQSFNFETALTEDTIIYAKLSAKSEKDDTPKTGVENGIGIAMFIIATSALGIAVLRRK